MNNIAKGSKADKLIKSYKAMQAVADMAPQGGLEGKLQEVHTVLLLMFLDNAFQCKFTEAEAIRFCEENKEQ